MSHKKNHDMPHIMIFMKLSEQKVSAIKYKKQKVRLLSLLSSKILTSKLKICELKGVNFDIFVFKEHW